MTAPALSKRQVFTVLEQFWGEAEAIARAVPPEVDRATAHIRALKQTYQQWSEAADAEGAAIWEASRFAPMASDDLAALRTPLHNGVPEERLLDVLVAEHLYGYRWLTDTAGADAGKRHLATALMSEDLSQKMFGTHAATGEEPLAEDWDYRIQEDCEEWGGVLWGSELAMQRLQDAGWWWDIRSPFAPTAAYSAGVTPHYVTGWNGRADILATGATMEEAICKAALLWIVDQRKEDATEEL